MNGTCSTCGGDEECITILVGKPEWNKAREDLGIDVRMILKWMLIE
jgi:hypothetical protein